MENPGRHSRENGNPFSISFMISAPWMPALAGMTNNDTVSLQREEFPSLAKGVSLPAGRQAFPKEDNTDYSDIFMRSYPLNSTMSLIL